MTNADMTTKRLETIAKMIEEGKDLNSIMSTTDYAMLSADTKQTNYIFNGSKVKIKGDLREIRFEAFGEVRMFITIDNHAVLTGEERVAVKIPKGMVDEIFNKKILTDTSIEITAEFTAAYGIFNLVSIDNWNGELIFPYAVCAGDNKNPNSGADICHHIYGYKKADYPDHCILCGSSIRMVKNVYEEKLGISYF